MIRVVVIDDHPALRAGLHTVLDAEPGIVFAGESDGDEESVWPLLNRTTPDLALLDYHLPHGDGLQLCYRIKQRVPAPKVIVFSAYAGPALALPATLAKADGILDKGVPARDLFEAIRLVNRGERLLPTRCHARCARTRSDASTLTTCRCSRCCSTARPSARSPTVLRRDAARRPARRPAHPQPAAAGRAPRGASRCAAHRCCGPSGERNSRHRGGGAVRG